MQPLLTHATLLFLLLLRDSSGDKCDNDSLSLAEKISIGQVNTVKETYELSTSLGTIVGLIEPTIQPHYNNTHMHTFRSIPFASPPVGKLRFSDPVDLEEPWPGKYLKATEVPTMCPLIDPTSGKVYGKEDCLYLNVYTPSHLRDTNRMEQRLLPVLVFIHGGAFMSGSSAAYGPGKLLSRDIVVVTTNYRLGALGYLSTGDSILPGNYGILDQISALRWVQRNIAQFGGDPNQVTLGGFSAGAASVGFHALSPLSKDLFHRGIMMGGGCFCDWPLMLHPKTGTRLLAEKLGCHTETSQDTRECLSTKSSEEIVAAQGSIHKMGIYPGWFAPVIDEGLRPSPFLPAPLRKLSPKPAPMIVGITSNEGLLFAAQSVLLSKQPSNVSAVYEEAARTIMTPWPHPDLEEDMKDVAEAFYYSKKARFDGGVLLEQMAEALSDHHEGYCNWDTAEYMAESGSPVYTYVMTHRDIGTPVLAAEVYKKMKSLGYKTPILDEDPSHGDDALYIFSFPFTPNSLSDRDQKVSQIFLNMITNFIISGSPQDDLETFGIADIPKWLPIQTGQPIGYYDIAVNPKMILKPFRMKEQHFWKYIVQRPESEFLTRTSLTCS